MSELSPLVIQDNQLAVATVAQTGELITGPSKTDITALVQTDRGPELAVKAVNLNGGGGGSYVLPPATSETLGGVKIGPGLSVTQDGTLSATGGSGGSLTYTTFNNIFGNTLNVSSLGNVDAVYKNGELLNKVNSIVPYTTYANPGTGSVDSSTNYHWNTVNSVAIQNLSNWQFRMIFKAGESTSEPGLIARVGYFHLGRDYGQSLKIWATDKDGNQILDNYNTGKQITPNVLSELILGFTGTKYYFKIREVGNTSWDITWEYASQAHVKDSDIQLCCLFNPWESATGGWGNQITVYQQSIKLGTENAPLLFDGATAVLGTDYEVGANLDVSTAPVPNTYVVSNGTITFGDTVNLSDEIIVATK